MSMTLESFMGGALYGNLVGTARMTNHGIRVLTYTCNLSVSRILRLPKALGNKMQPGGPHFVVIHLAEETPGVTITLKDYGQTTTLAVLYPGDSVEVWLEDASTDNGVWRVDEVRQINTVGPVSSVPRPLISENPSDSYPVYDPYCPGQCVTGAGAECPDVPERVLDESDDPYTVPMYINSCTAQNTYREPLEGAPLFIPTVLALQFKASWEVDPLHPWVVAGGVLSQSLKDALWGDGSIVHTLEWKEFGDKTSRHWHHLRWVGTLGPRDVDWDQLGGAAGLDCKYHLWEKVIEYTAAGVARNLTIQIMCEYTTDTDEERGAWGSLWNVYVFTDEVEPEFADDDEYTPADSSDPIAFSRLDPAVSGRCTSPAQGSALKFVHPQCIIAASVPTTMESPCNYAPKGKPYIEHPEFSYCYQVKNGTPWVTDTDPWRGSYREDNTIDEYFEVEENVAFGLMVGSVSKAAMTLGGDTPTSALEQWLCIENGKGEGRTILKPQHPGWSETSGQLQLTDVNVSALIFWCAPEQDNVLGCDVTDPLNPGQLTRKTHKCFTVVSGTLETFGCCVGILDGTVMQTHQAVLSEYCVRIDTTYGGGSPPGDPCDAGSQECNVVGTFISTFNLHVEDYSYDFGAGEDNRTISFASHEPDPAFTASGRDPTQDDEWLGDIEGTWSFGAGTAQLDIEAAGDSWVGYKPTDAIYSEVVWEGEVDLSTTDANRLGMYVRDKYLFMLDRTPDAEIARLYYGLDDATWLLLEEIDLTAYADGDGVDLFLGTIAWEITAEFESLSCVFSHNGDTITTIEAEDCRQLDGEVGVWVGNPMEDVTEFTGLKVSDSTAQYLDVTASMTPAGVSCDVPEALGQLAEGTCEVEVNPDCGVTYCDCTHSESTGYGIYSFDYPLTDDLNVGSYGYDQSAFLEDCDELGTCPNPFRALSFHATGCNNSVDGYVPWCNGAETWYVSCVVNP